jgi:hypothetical protein
VVAVVLLLANRRGVGPAALGLRLPRLPDGRVAASRTVRIIGWCFFAQVAGGIVNALLQTGHLPDNHANAAQDLFSVVDSIQAGVVEELVVLAFVVVTLRQAGRPWWEVTAAALVLRAAYHIYYGPGVFGILIWAALFYWIYLRFRTILPLIVTHALWDMVAFLGRAAIGVAVVGELLILAIWLASFILWLIERNNPAGGPWPHVVGAGAYAGVGPGGYAGVGPEGYAGHGSHQAPVAVPFAGHGSHQAPVAVPFAGLPPPGWHPDPSGLNRWRWWDGQRWTDHVSQHSAR